MQPWTYWQTLSRVFFKCDYTELTAICCIDIMLKIKVLHPRFKFTRPVNYREISLPPHE